jgi:hypothetical protein
MAACLLGALLLLGALMVWSQMDRWLIAALLGGESRMAAIAVAGIAGACTAMAPTSTAAVAMVDRRGVGDTRAARLVGQAIALRCNEFRTGLENKKGLARAPSLFRFVLPYCVSGCGGRI